jgi:predicted molibdopterin-dependent oxidoreductase YjgC
VRRGDIMAPVSWDQAIEQAASGLAGIVREHGPDAVAFLVSPMSTNEEAYLAQKLARAVIGTNSIDFTSGAVARATAEPVRRAFGTEILPADMTRLARSNVIVAIGDDIEASHNVAALRIKDAVVRDNARLIVVSPRWNELCDFTQAWLQPQPGREAAVLDALARSLLDDADLRDRLAKANVSGIDTVGGAAGTVEGLDEAAATLQQAAKDPEAVISIVYTPAHVGADAASATATAAANLAIAACGAEAAPASLFILPTDVNVHGLRDMGATPEYLPGYSPAADGAAREALAGVWGAELPASRGLTAGEALAAAAGGRVKAMVVVGDNPLMLAPDKTTVRRALESL